jgi:hypothetical protein
MKIIPRTSRTLWLWILLFNIITMVVCSSCKKQFRNNQGLAKHQHTCKLIKSDVALLLQKRANFELSRKAAKIARREGRDVGEERVALAEPSQDRQADVPSEIFNDLEAEISQVRFTIW